MSAVPEVMNYKSGKLYELMEFNSRMRSLYLNKIHLLLYRPVETKVEIPAL